MLVLYVNWMFWFSAAVLFILTLCAWQTGRHLQEDSANAGLRRVYFAAAICGAIGTLCFLAAALI